MRCDLRLLILAMSLLVAADSRAADVSTLWGDHGERWSPTSSTSLLPDFRYAGYHSGRDPIPDMKAVANVMDFGAKGDGKTDDTAAFLAAVKAASDKGGGAVEIPPLRFVITQVIRLPSRVVLRGGSPGETVLVIPKSLQDLGGENVVEEEKSGYAFSGGFITIAGKPKTTRVARLAADAKRGERKLVLASVGKLKVGDWIRVVTNNDPSLGRYLHNDRFDAGKATFDHKNFIDWVARIDAIDKNTLTLDRPLRIDLRKPWQPEVWTYEPGVEEAGVEYLSFEFAGRPKKEHLKEEGFNAIYFDGADNCWVRGVEFFDADNGINVTRSRFVSVNVAVFREKKRTSPSGHHALWARQAQDCLFDTFVFRTQYVHDLSVEGFSCGNVFEKGDGIAMNFDHHANAPYENLFTDINVRDISRLWQSGGRPDRLPHTGVRSVIWGISYDKGKLPKLPDWPQLIVVGVKGYAKGPKGPNDLHVEEASGAVKPANLFEAQKSFKPARATTGGRGGE